jgi:hypothetical protein
MMTPRENFFHFLKGEPIEWTPIIDDQLVFMPEMIPENVARGFIEQQKPFTGSFGGPDNFGIDWEFVPSVGGSMVRPGKPYLDDIEEWEEKVHFPDLDSWDWEGCAKENAEFLNTDKIIRTTIYTGYFERLIALLDFEGAAMAVFDEDQQPYVHALFEKLTDLYIDMIRRMKKYFNVEFVEIHDDWGNQRSLMFSVETHREMILPYVKRLVAAAHAEGVYMEQHSCGKIEKLIPNMIETGIDTWTGQKSVIDKHMLVDTYGDKFKFAVEIRPDGPVDDATAMKMVEDAYEEWKGKNVWFIDRAAFTPEQKKMIADYVHQRGVL